MDTLTQWDIQWCLIHVHCNKNRVFFSMASRILADGRIIHAAAERNKVHILSYLQDRSLIRDETGYSVLEVASGTGQHAAYIQRAYKSIHWQTTEFNRDMFTSIKSWLKSGDQPDPVFLSAARPFIEQLGSYSRNYFDLVFNANMMHISPIDCTTGLIRGAWQVLKPGGYLVVYGPFRVDGQFTTESNREFDEQLKSKHPDYGLRDIEWVQTVAEKQGFTLVERLDVPANNFIVTWRK